MGLKLGLITIVVPEYDMGTRFFVDGLGFELITDEDQGHKRWVVVAPPGGGSHILLARATNSRFWSPEGEDSGPFPTLSTAGVERTCALWRRALQSKRNEANESAKITTKDYSRIT